MDFEALVTALEETLSTKEFKKLIFLAIKEGVKEALFEVDSEDIESCVSKAFPKPNLKKISEDRMFV